MENKKKIDDLFKHELGSYSETPPPAVWDALEKRLDPSRNPRGLYTKLGYVALLGILVVLSIVVARNNATRETALNSMSGTNTVGKNAEHATGSAIVPSENNNTTTGSLRQIADNQTDNITGNSPASNINNTKKQTPASANNNTQPIATICI